MSVRENEKEYPYTMVQKSQSRETSLVHKTVRIHDKKEEKKILGACHDKADMAENGYMQCRAISGKHSPCLVFISELKVKMAVAHQRDRLRIYCLFFFFSSTRLEDFLKGVIGGENE